MNASVDTTMWEILSIADCARNIIFVHVDILKSAPENGMCIKFSMIYYWPLTSLFFFMMEEMQIT